ncbi:MAG: 50S ribosomal protein L23 [bacterium]|nr:50S ribosomal protein L23 [bacterium]
MVKPPSRNKKRNYDKKRDIRKNDSSIVLEPYQVVMRPLVTEKGMHRSTRYNQYAFEVNPLATKSVVRTAIEELFNVRVVKVRTQNRIGKPRRHRVNAGYTKRWKKAIVTLHEEDRIDFY